MGKRPQSNPVATIYAWTEALKHIGRLEKNRDLQEFCAQLQRAVQHTVNEKRCVTRDIAILTHRDTPIQEGKHYVNTDNFIAEVRHNLREGWPTQPVICSDRK